MADGVYTQFYDPHLHGTHASNPAMDMMAATQMMYTRHLTELCVNRFEWTGLPKEIDARFLELNLFWRALAVFFKDTGKDETGTDKFMAMQAMGTGEVNHQDVPTHFSVYAPNMKINYPRLVSGVDCVPIWANYLRVPELDKVNNYSRKLASLDRTIEINSENMRRTKVWAVPEPQKTSAENLMKQHIDGQGVVFGAKGSIENVMEGLAVIDLSGDSSALPNLIDAKAHMWNECMTMLGINNANQDKKERLVASEVSANDEQVNATRFIALNARQQAAEQINELFGLDVWVDFRKAPEPELDLPATDEGVEVDGDNKLKAVS